MSERKSISPKVRFDVFKKDGFTCQYCGRKTPVVVLELDHIIPVSKGGTNDIENLTTSCYECNRGKGAGLLDERAPVVDMHEQSVLMLEKEMQLKEYNHVKEMVREREEDDIEQLLQFWDELADNRARKFPNENSLRMFLKSIPREDIKDAMVSAYAKSGDWLGVDYLYGILHNIRKQRLGSND